MLKSIQVLFSTCEYINKIQINMFMGDYMVFNVTFNNISVISWRSVLLVEETEVPGENH
jgi:hypothetical protein